jgi:hypothetical protein
MKLTQNRGGVPRFAPFLAPETAMLTDLQCKNFTCPPGKKRARLNDLNAGVVLTLFEVDE